MYFLTVLTLGLASGFSYPVQYLSYNDEKYGYYFKCSYFSFFIYTAMSIFYLYCYVNFLFILVGQHIIKC